MPIHDSNVDSAVKRAQGMEEERKASRKKIYVDLGAMEEEINLDQEVVGAMGLKRDIQQVIANAVQAAVTAAMPSIVKAVTEACVASLRERVDPLFLHTQFKIDEVDQATRMQNLRITGIEEEDNESEEALCNKVCKVAEAVGAPIRQDDISCVRVGKSPAAGAKPRHTIVQFALRRKRDGVYNARFALKDKSNFKGVYINEDLTPIRHAVLMKAKKAPSVKGATTKHGKIICKMNDDSFKVLKTPDDLFEIGLDDVNYKDFKLALMV